MASSEQGRRLTEAHRLEQQRVRAEFLAEFLALWTLLDSTRLDETGSGWVQAVLPLVRIYRDRSAEVATVYYERFAEVEAPAAAVAPDRARAEMPAEASPRQDEASPVPSSRPAPVQRPAVEPRRASPRPTRSGVSLPVVEPRPRRVRLNIDDTAFGPRDQTRRARVEIPDIDWTAADRAVVVSLNVTGPIGQKSKAKRGKPLQVARNESLVEASGAATRHVLTGGRQSLLTLVEGDMKAIGWIRVTDGDPCYFCAMLASRGAVYKKDSFSQSDPRFTGPAEFKVHDSCACTMEVVYSRQATWPGRAAEFHRLWQDNIAGRYSGREALNAFRRLYEQQQRDARRTDVA